MKDKTNKYIRDHTNFRYGPNVDVNTIRDRVLYNYFLCLIEKWKTKHIDLKIKFLIKFYNDELSTYKLENIQEYFEDPFIREIRLEKEKQIKKEEDEKIVRRQLEKVKNNFI